MTFDGVQVILHHMRGAKSVQAERGGKCREYRPSDGPTYEWKRCVHKKRHRAKHKDLTGWEWTDAVRRRWDKA